MSSFLRSLVTVIGLSAGAFVVGYSFDLGSRSTPARLKLIDAMKASDEASERLIITLKQLQAKHCTWDRA